VRSQGRAREKILETTSKSRGTATQGWSGAAEGGQSGVEIKKGAERWIGRKGALALEEQDMGGDRGYRTRGKNG